jgi:TetR/AcrR family transcriptional repressor of nem operon
LARPRKFSRQELLEKAIDVFWEKGYEATTTQDLQERLGIHPGSLFGTFGDKQSLFREALDLYEENVRAMLFALLEKPVSKREGLRLFFSRMIDFLLKERTQGKPGCFMVNSLVELCSRDEAMDRRSKVNRARLEMIFFTTLQHAIDTGEIRDRPVEETRALARAFVANVLSIRVLVRIGAEPEMLHDVARVALAQLDTPLPAVTVFAEGYYSQAME